MLEHSLRIIKEIWKIIGWWLGCSFLYLFIVTHVTASLPVFIIICVAVSYGILRLTQDVLNKEVPWCKYKLGKHSFRPMLRYHDRLYKPFTDLPQAVMINKSVICYKCFWAIHRIGLASSISVQGLTQQEYLSKLDYYRLNVTEKKISG